MTDYKAYLPQHRDNLMHKTERDINIFAGLSSLIALAIITTIIMRSCVDGVVKESERREEYEPRPRWASETYRKPAAYRLQSPTQSEMDHVHGLLAVQEVMR